MTVLKDRKAASGQKAIPVLLVRQVLRDRREIPVLPAARSLPREGV